MQAPSPDVMSKILDLLVSPATSIAAIYFYDRFIARKRNGGNSAKEISASVSTAVSHAVLQGLDKAITEGFDQLRRDLTTSIEKATENSIMRYLWEAERRREKR